MNLWRIRTKVFAFFSLLFAFFIQANSQTEISPTSVYNIQAGTKILVQMDNEINSKVASVNDTFTTTLAEPLIIREVVVLPVGAVIEGRVTKVNRASAGGKDGSLTVSFETLRLADSAKREIEGVLDKELEAVSSQKLKLLTIIGGTAIGGIVGALSKTENGALIGVGIGAGAGTAVALLQKGKDVSIKADEKFEIRLTKNVILPAQDY
jgi:hypothetical protein